MDNFVGQVVGIEVNIVELVNWRVPNAERTALLKRPLRQQLLDLSGPADGQQRGEAFSQVESALAAVDFFASAHQLGRVRSCEADGPSHLDQVL